ncbi:MAG: P-II family nitrogen regulator, partial [Desulfobacterales bacterium]
SYRGQTHKVNLLSKVCIRIAVNDDFVQKTIESIIDAAKSDEIGDGKIFVAGFHAGDNVVCRMHKS